MRDQTMNAVVINEYGTADQLEIRAIPTPSIGKNEILIKVNAAGINRLDIYQREGNYPAPDGYSQKILGLEVAGTVAAIGESVDQWAIGDRVFTLLGGEGYAQYVKIDAAQVLPTPDNITDIEAASLPETLYTVWHNIFQRGALKAGENVLIHGGSSGIGITAIQLVRCFGAIPYVTVGNEEKVKATLDLGAERAINYRAEDFQEALQSVGFDLILDMIGGDYFPKNIGLLREEGRLVHINAMRGIHVDLNLMHLMQKRISITGSTLRSREITFKEALTAEIREKCLPYIASGDFKPVIYQTFPLEKAADAHRLMESSDHIGKIILTVD